jgi:hypothetical protein
MPLSQEHQISLLKDLLNNQQSDCCGSVAECEQVERLVKSLMANGNYSQDAISFLTEIYEYSQNGVNASNLDDHISSHLEQLSQWVENMDSLS